MRLEGSAGSRFYKGTSTSSLHVGTGEGGACCQQVCHADILLLPHTLPSWPSRHAVSLFNRINCCKLPLDTHNATTSDKNLFRIKWSLLQTRFWYIVSFYLFYSLALRFVGAMNGLWFLWLGDLVKKGTSPFYRIHFIDSIVGLVPW